MATAAGLVKVRDASALDEVFRRLCHLSMAGIYVFSASRERAFLDAVALYPASEHFDFGIKDDERYFIYLADADSSESATVIVEIVSYGCGESVFSKKL